jgi:NADPH:quinone reductase-like Zn-dependent oxidoreductase
MKAVVYDKQEKFVYCEKIKPVPDDNDVLVKIFAASLNALDDRSLRMGMIPKNKIFGADIAGRVEAVGKNVSVFHVGDDVAADLSGCGLGGFAEYVAVPQGVLVKKPSCVSFEDAAALPVAALTALQALRDKGSVKKGQCVLVCGAGGGVGTFAVQLAKYFGAHVTAVCGPKNAEIMLTLGADRVIDYTKEDFLKQAARYDLILAVNGSYSLSAYKRALKPNGACVVVGGALRQIFKTMLLGPLVSMGGKRIRLLAAKPNPKDLAFLLELVERGHIKPVIDRRYPLSETAKALEYLSRGHACGKVLITVKEDEYEGDRCHQIRKP